MAAGIDYTYRYGFPSGLEVANDTGPQLALATCDLDHKQPYFFNGKVRHPRILGDMLHTLSDIVRTHYFLPMPEILDPVLTSNEHLLRLEGFSGCCGVYARVDLPREAFDGECHGRGTTNVDFNAPMRQALKRLRDNENVEFAVGKDEVALTRGNDRTVEKKVTLPVRWIKSFSEVQAYQPRLELKMEISAADALRFVRSLPKASRPKQPSYAISQGRGIRLSQRPARGAVKILGTHRVRAMEPLLPRAKTVKVWADEDTGTSAWQICFPVGSFFMMISPEVYRGFSGEGQILSALAHPPSDADVAKVRAGLTWQNMIDAADLGQSLSLDTSTVTGALAVLGSRGLAGYDAASGSYFHRELPFDLSLVEAMQPRLKNARKLVDKGGISAVSQDPMIYQVPGSGTQHRVTFSDDGDKCTCPWFSKYLGGRGPCKHILAAHLVHGGDD